MQRQVHNGKPVERPAMPKQPPKQRPGSISVRICATGATVYTGPTPKD